ncbi:type IV secretion system protein [Croceitalea marina]|uniref:Type IV secretion system protein n=1 Tax=Croceitalea marina TaxID=1775166 RepID=A0ABW5MVB4_9FLAO
MYLVRTETGFRGVVNTIFDQYVDDAFNSLGPTLGIGFQVAKIGLIIFALTHYSSDDRADVLKALKWFPLMFILWNYREFAYSIFEFYDNLGKAFIGTQHNWDSIGERVALAQIDVAAKNGLSWNLLDMDIDALQSIMLVGMASSVTTFAHIISTLIFVGIKALSIIYLFIIIIFGPINIGLSFIPAFSNMWRAWLQKFMSVCLWIPMLYVVDLFMVNLVDKLVEHLINTAAKDIALILTSSLLILMTSFFYIKAPTLANFVVQGMNISGSGIVSKPKHYGKKAVQTAMDVKTGGASKGVRTLIQ